MCPRPDSPLLTQQEIAAVINDGHHWNGDGAPWSIRETTQGNSGQLSSSRQGRGMDFSETRAYQPGDEPRQINWRATARVGKPMVSVYHEDLAASACFLIDQRTCMRFATRKQLKVTQALKVALFLASWESGRGNAIAGLLSNDTLQWIPSTTGRLAINRLTQAANQPCPPTTHSSAMLKTGITRIIQQQPAGSHVYLISDFHDLDEESHAAIQQLGKQYSVWAIQVFDVAERDLPVAGEINLAWKNDKHSRAINTNDKTQLIRHRNQFLDRQNKLSELFTRSDIEFSSLATTADDIAQSLRVENHAGD